MTHPYIAAQLAADHQQRIHSAVAAHRRATDARRYRAQPSRTMSSISMLRRRLKLLAVPHARTVARPSYDGAARRSS